MLLNKFAQGVFFRNMLRSLERNGFPSATVDSGLQDIESYVRNMLLHGIQPKSSIGSYDYYFDDSVDINCDLFDERLQAEQSDYFGVDSDYSDISKAGENLAIVRRELNEAERKNKMKKNSEAEESVPKDLTNQSENANI
jgi:hypothetical protein